MPNYLPYPMGFQPLHDGPIDNRMVVENVSDLNSFIQAIRYEGMIAYVKSEKKVYILQGGTQDSDWKLLTPDLITDDLNLKFSSSKTVPTFTTVGGIEKGTDPSELNELTLSEVIEKMLYKASIAPSFSKPIVSLNLNGSNTVVEEGTQLTVSFSTTFNQRDGGEENGSPKLFQDGIEVLDLPSSHTFQVKGSVEFNAIQAYKAGVNSKTTEDGVIWSNTIAEGQVTSSSKIFVGIRAILWGEMDSVPINSIQLRSLNKVIANKSNQTLILETSKTKNKRFVFAYPASYGKLENVIYKEGLNSDVIETFDNFQIAVEDASLSNPITYEVYVSDSNIIYDDDVTYIFEF